MWGSCRGVLQWVHWCFGGGSLVIVGVFCFCLVVPFLPLGRPGNRFWLVVVFWLVWSPVLVVGVVGYLRIADGVCGFSYFSSARFSLLFSFLRVRFSFSSCLSFWQV